MTYRRRRAYCGSEELCDTTHVRIWIIDSELVKQFSYVVDRRKQDRLQVYPSSGVILLYLAAGLCDAICKLLHLDKAVVRTDTLKDRLNEDGKIEAKRVIVKQFVVGLTGGVYIRKNFPVAGGLKEAVKFGRPHLPGYCGTKSASSRLMILLVISI